MSSLDVFLGSNLLKSPSFPTTVIFLIISCFFDLTIADVLSVSLLKKAGGWEELGGERDPALQHGGETHKPLGQIYNHDPKRLAPIDIPTRPIYIDFCSFSV